MITLYATPTCPYSAKVRETLKALNLAYTEVNIHEEENEKNLITLGGKRQTPFLVDDEHDIKMYDSYKIVDFLEGTYGMNK